MNEDYGVAEHLPAIAERTQEVVTEALLLVVAENEPLARYLPHIAAHATSAVTEAVLSEVAKSESATLSHNLSDIAVYVREGLTDTVCKACGRTLQSVRKGALSKEECAARPEPTKKDVVRNLAAVLKLEFLV